jgi:hypothetical protein
MPTLRANGPRTVGSLAATCNFFGSFFFVGCDVCISFSCWTAHAADILLDKQAKATGDATSLDDAAPNPLFHTVDPEVLKRPTYSSFIALLDNYISTVNDVEVCFCRVPPTRRLGPGLSFASCENGFSSCGGSAAALI